jgi:hydroxyacylglutathione hydrolase
MLLKYFYDEALAHASYMVGCQKTGEAILIDPSRSIDHYLEAAQREGMKIVGTAETHIHADYVSGSRELAERVGAVIYVSDEGPADWKYTFVGNYKHVMLNDGSEFAVGNIKFKVIHTPGHTPESVCFVLTDVGGGAEKPMGVFTGDFVFVGTVGRPDLLEKAAGQAGTAEQGARELYQSVQLFKKLPDYLQVWPSHGAGSACGKGIGSIRSSTVGYEKLFNAGLQIDSENSFVEYILSDQPEAPPYFAVMKHVNKHGPKVLGKQGMPPKLEVSELAAAIESEMVVDLSAPTTFATRHVPGTINVWTKAIVRDAGWFIDYEKPLYLILDQTELAETMRILLEIGIDGVAGYFEVDEVLKAGLATESFKLESPAELRAQIESGQVYLVDVRTQTEWTEGRIEQANHSFLGKLLKNVAQLPADKPIVFQCRSGSRSAAACAIAQAKGIKNPINLDGGIIRWQQEGFPVVTDHPQHVQLNQ